MEERLASDRKNGADGVRARPLRGMCDPAAEHRKANRDSRYIYYEQIAAGLADSILYDEALNAM